LDKTTVQTKNNQKYVIGVVYRHPTSKHEEFINALNNSIGKITSRNRMFYLLGDFNLNIALSATASSMLIISSTW